MTHLKYMLGAFLLISSTMISCSDVKFSNSPSTECANAEDCIINPDGTETYRRVLTVDSLNNKVDLLFVVDNSGTMVQEQQQIAARFQGLIQQINNSNIDWRIAIATTDNYPVNAGSINGGEYREGKLVPFRNSSGVTNRYFIDKSMSDAQTLFQNTIQRPESIACTTRPQDCTQMVSGDERGILTAVKQVLSPSPVAFMRTGAQLHIIFIADEDERSNGGGYSGMSLDTNDKPETLIGYLENTGKRFQIHSIINIPSNLNNYSSYIESGFESCVANQITNTSAQEYVGCHYAMATALSGGVIGNIRSTNYTSIFQDIGYSIQDTSLGQIDFNCAPVEIIITPVEDESYPSQLSNPYIVLNPGTRYITFNPPLPPGSNLNVEWTCKRGSL